ncbi:MAG: carboxymuconolactone decarboxylase family protein [Paracoccaceae bacterium]|nr:carboxymuconolactone decarboxylase family protein [Paracoccaceae bacterium]
MTQSSSPFEEMMQAAQEMGKAINPSLGLFSVSEAEEIWPATPKDWMEMMFDNALNKDGLDAKTKIFLTSAGLKIKGAKNEIALRQCVRHLLEVDAKPQEISEKIGLMSIFAGIPVMARAMELASHIIGPDEDKET